MANEPWSDFATRRLTSIHDTAREKAYHGAYVNILKSCFPDNEGFTVCPMAHPLENPHMSIDFTVEYHSESLHRPVLMVELKRALTINKISVRNAADAQARERIQMMAELIPLNDVYLVSIFGKICKIYNLNKVNGVIWPRRGTARNSTGIIDRAPKSGWNIDLSTRQGRRKLAEKCQEVKGSCFGAL